MNLLRNKVVSMNHFLALWVKFTLNKDNLFKLNNKHKFAQLGRLNTLITVEEAFLNS